MQRFSLLARLIVATVMMLGMVAFTNSAVTADEVTETAEATETVAATETAAATETQVVTQDVDDETPDATEAPVDELPDTGNGPQSGDGQSYLLLTGVAALFLIAAAMVVRRARLN